MWIVIMIVDALMFLVGLVALIGGRVALVPSRTLTDGSARLFGAILALSAVLAFGVPFSMGFLSGLRVAGAGAQTESLGLMAGIGFTGGGLLLALLYLASVGRREAHS